MSASSPIPRSQVTDEERDAIVADYKAGKEVALQFFVGQGMKATHGSANPEMLKKLIVEII